MLPYFFKKRAIRNYLLKLPVLLKADYGLFETYTAKQVASSVRRHKLSSNYQLYAIAMFSPVTEYESHDYAQDSVLSYELARQEIADLFFQGDRSFSVPKVTSVGVYFAGGSEPESAASVGDGRGSEDG